MDSFISVHIYILFSPVFILPSSHTAHFSQFGLSRAKVVYNL